MPIQANIKFKEKGKSAKQTLPEDFKVVLEKNKEALEFYESLSYSAKKKYYQWITSAKKDETRVKRIDKAVDNLLKKIRL